MKNKIKKCTSCLKDKPLSEFHKHKGRKMGVTEKCKECRNVFMVEKKHNLPEGGLLKLKEKHNYRCAICNTHNDELTIPLAVDHDHTTNKIRGLLCGNCNNGLGRFKDNIEFLENAIKYLKNE